MDEEEEVRTSKKWVSGRIRAKNLNPFIKDVCDVSKRAGEEDEEEDDE